MLSEVRSDILSQAATRNSVNWIKPSPPVRVPGKSMESTIRFMCSTLSCIPNLIWNYYTNSWNSSSPSFSSSNASNTLFRNCFSRYGRNRPTMCLKTSTWSRNWGLKWRQFMNTCYTLPFSFFNSFQSLRVCLKKGCYTASAADSLILGFGLRHLSRISPKLVEQIFWNGLNCVLQSALRMH